MNSNLNRALAAALAVFGGVAPALAQFDADALCIDPNTTNPYSNPFIYQAQRNALFGAAIGVVGTTTYNTTLCPEGGGPIVGRIGFTIGPQGSIQDDLAGDALHDNNLRLTRSTNFGDEVDRSLSYPGPYVTPALGGNSYARIFVTRTTLPTGTTGTGTTTTTNYLYGSNGISLSFAGRGGRYIYTDGRVDGTSTTDSVYARLIIDILADTARLTWTLQNNLNTTDTVSLGLWFGQQVELIEESSPFPRYVDFGGANPFPTTYTTIPGRRPLTVDERFPDPSGITSTAVPTYVDFSLNQQSGYGLQLVNSPSVLAALDPSSGTDLTPVDEFVIGEAPFLIDGRNSTTDPLFGDVIINPDGAGNDDAAPLVGDPSYIQKWFPVETARGASRTITAYYRSTNFDSSYSPQFTGYSVAVDPPKAVPTNTNPASTGKQITIRVNVDNTGGFTNPDKQVEMTNANVVLQLPAGLTNPADGSQTISRDTGYIGPITMGHVDFTVNVDPTVAGALSYTCIVTPDPGPTKTITGVINVAASPRLLVRSGPNLVSPPWKFNSSASWDTVLGLTLNSQFQAYTWDSKAQKYIPQATAQRGVGTWIVSGNDQSYLSLGGSPQQPTDQFPDPSNNDVALGGRSPSVRLHTGWNLVGNPYDYGLPLGELVGVPTGGISSGQSLAFDQLVAQQYTNGAFSYYDATTGDYHTIAGQGSSTLPPNNGYWLYVNQDFDLHFPPLYQPFLRSAGPSAPKQRFDNWKLQLAAASTSSRDTQNFVGIVRSSVDASRLSLRKSPMPPTSATRPALYTYVTGDAGFAMSESLRRSTGSQSFKYNVFTQNAGPVTVSWPNLKSIPSNLAVTITDPVSKRSINARSTSGYTFSSGALSTRTLTVNVDPLPVPQERISYGNYMVVKIGSVKQVRFGFQASQPGSATLQVYSGSKLVSTAASDMDLAVGQNTVMWSIVGTDGQPLPSGSYTLKISATGENGVTTVYQLPLAIRR